MKAGRIVMLVIGVVVALMSIGLIVGGGGLLFAYGTQRDADGFFTTDTVELSTPAYAIQSEGIDLGSLPSELFPSGRLATIRISAETLTGTDAFIGIGAEDDVAAYLADVSRAEVADIDRRDITYRFIDGSATPGAPGEAPIWVASAEGSGVIEVEWELESGQWTVVVMNADASDGIAVDASAGARSEFVLLVAAGLLAFGLFLGLAAAALLVLAFASTREPAGDRVVAADLVYPVLLEGDLDPGLSRWQWLVKWFLAIPHYVVLFFLWIAFGVVTFIAFFAILFTARYPRGLFDFNVGVIRWSWRVAYYSYSVLGTDRYPPFSLADADYPARFDVEYPERLSRGLVLVKWWLLAIPHYLIVGLFTSGLIWWTTEIGTGQVVVRTGGGLISILVLVAVIALLFTGRYLPGLFDLVIGLNRWVYRVWAYAALMRDEYPPFRLDTGGLEPAASTTPEPSAPAAS